MSVAELMLVTEGTAERAVRAACVEAVTAYSVAQKSASTQWRRNCRRGDTGAFADLFGYLHS